MKYYNLLLSTALMLFISSCAFDSNADSSSDSSSNAAQDEKVENLENAIEKTKDAFSDLLKDGNKDGESVEIVNWRELKDFLPNKMSGLKLDVDNIEGQTTSLAGFKFSNVEVEYSDGDSKFEVNVLDLGGVGFLVKSMASWADASIDSDTSDGYQRTTEYEGYKAFEEYNDRRKSGSLSVLVEDRFVVSVNGREIEMDDLKDAIDDLNIKKLARMAK